MITLSPIAQLTFGGHGGRRVLGGAISARLETIRDFWPRRILLWVVGGRLARRTRPLGRPSFMALCWGGLMRWGGHASSAFFSQTPPPIFSYDTRAERMTSIARQHSIRLQDGGSTVGSTDPLRPQRSQPSQISYPVHTPPDDAQLGLPMAAPTPAYPSPSALPPVKSSSPPDPLVDMPNILQTTLLDFITLVCPTFSAMCLHARHTIFDNTHHCAGRALFCRTWRRKNERTERGCGAPRNFSPRLLTARWRCVSIQYSSCLS